MLRMQQPLGVLVLQAFLLRSKQLKSLRIFSLKFLWGPTLPISRPLKSQDLVCSISGKSQNQVYVSNQTASFPPVSLTALNLSHRHRPCHVFLLAQQYRAVPGRPKPIPQGAPWTLIRSQREVFCFVLFFFVLELYGSYVLPPAVVYICER